MIDLNLVKAELQSVTRRATRRYEAEVWGTGQFDAPPYDLLPDVPEKALAAAKRIAGMTQSLGPRIVGIKKYLTLGDINWGGKDEDLDERLRALDLEELADQALEQGLYAGMLAGIVRKPRIGETDEGEPLAGAPVIELLTGHTEPLFDAESPSRVAGIFQAWLPLDAREKGWRVRIYDFDQQTMTEWRKLTEPYQVGGRPFEVVLNAPMPRYQILRRGRGNMPLGDLELALPLLKSDWSSQVRGDRAEENTAFAQLVISGMVEAGDDERSPANVILVEEGGSAQYLVPGDLSQIHEHHDRKIDRLRRDMNLPGGVLSGSNISGEALREDNAHAIADAKHKAQKTGRFLTDLTGDYAEELGKARDAAGEVTVGINKEFEAATAIERTVMLYDKGLLPHDAAVRAVSVYVPTWSDEEVEEYIEQQRELIPEPPEPVEAADDEE